MVIIPTFDVVLVPFVVIGEATIPFVVIIPTFDVVLIPFVVIGEATIPFVVIIPILLVLVRLDTLSILVLLDVVLDSPFRAGEDNICSKSFIMVK